MMKRFLLIGSNYVFTNIKLHPESTAPVIHHITDDVQELLIKQPIKRITPNNNQLKSLEGQHYEVFDKDTHDYMDLSTSF